MSTKRRTGSPSRKNSSLKPTRSDAAPPSTSSSGQDVALLCGVSDDGNGVHVLRQRSGRVEAGTLRKLEEGKPILGEVVRLKPREESPLLCDVEVEMDNRPHSTDSPSSGPAQVATDQYRKNWDAIYRRSARKHRQLLN